jgi:RNA recognition motif-containing protein
MTCNKVACFQIENLRQYFLCLQVTNIRLPRDERKPKGFGYVEFGNRSSLISALTMVDTVCNSVLFNVDFNFQAGFHGDLVSFFKRILRGVFPELVLVILCSLYNLHL